jgi:hypothetical protein
MRNYCLDKPLHVILNKSILAYSIYVILIANKEFKKNGSGNGHMRAVVFIRGRRQLILKTCKT